MDADAAQGVGEVYAIYLQPDAVGTGVGKAMFAQGVEDLSSMGYARAMLWVLENNERTRRFYEVAGWTPDGAEKTEDWNGYPLREVRYAIAMRS